MKLLALVITIYHGGDSPWMESVWVGDYEKADCLDMAHVISKGLNSNATVECGEIQP